MGIENKSIKMIDLLDNIKSGKYAMPTFQRQYVWDMERIERLWDSILLDYPISTFLFWKIDENNTTRDTYFCPFLKECTFSSKSEPVTKNYKLELIDLNKTNISILDGQQRMTSLYLTLFGDIYIKKRYAKKTNTKEDMKCDFLIELDKSKTDITEDEYNYKKYNMQFVNKAVKSNTTFNIKEIVNNPQFRNNDDKRKDAISKAVENVPENQKQYAIDLLNKLCKKVFDEECFNYTLIYDMNYSDALEMFIRFNSGGKILKKSEITMTILEAYWSNAKSEFDKALQGGYANFSTDFMIKLGFMLFGDIVKFNINRSLVDKMKSNWGKIKKTILQLEELLKEQDMSVENYVTGWNILMPVIYVIYNNENYKDQIEGIMAYITRASLLGYLNSGSARKLTLLRSKIKENGYVLDLNLIDNIEKLRFEV